MTNVLPPEAAQELWSIQRARFIIVGSAVALAAAALAAAALLPGYVVLHTIAAPDIGPVMPVEVAHDKQAIEQARAYLEVMRPIVGATTTPVGALTAALALRPVGVFVDRISYRDGSIVLGGSANSRERVNAYQKALTSDGRFSSIIVPVGDLVGNEEKRFSITLSGDF